MPVLMMVEIPGADAAFAEAMRHAGVLDELQTARGFRGHWSGAASSGYRAIELWDSREDCQAFAEGHFAPKAACREPSSRLWSSLRAELRGQARTLGIFSDQ